MFTWRVNFYITASPQGRRVGGCALLIRLDHMCLPLPSVTRTLFPTLCKHHWGKQKWIQMDQKCFGEKNSHKVTGELHSHVVVHTRWTFFEIPLRLPMEKLECWDLFVMCTHVVFHLHLTVRERGVSWCRVSSFDVLFYMCLYMYI
jgi:hypothetical protein